MINDENYPNPDALKTRNIVSSTDCTGIMQAKEENEEDLEFIEDMYDLPDQEL